MALLNKDGTPYQTFTKPNPLTKGQVDLDKKDLIFHNFNWTSEKEENKEVSTVEQLIEELPKKSQPSKRINNFLDLLKQEAKTLKKEIPVEQEKPEPIEEINSDGTVIVHCHPLIEKTRIDNLYEEKRITSHYGDKFDFEAIIIEYNDFEIALYAKEKIQIGSIIYPSQYKNGEKLEMFRWWKISQIEENKTGWIIFAQVTEKARDFSD